MKTRVKGGKREEAYDHPEYYEIAFSYQEVTRQVDYFEEVCRKFYRRKPRRFLDLGCGPSPQLLEIARRGYEGVGLDINVNMLEYLRKKAEKECLKIETVHADMRDFKLRKKCDFAYALSSSVYVKSNEEFLKHLSCVANSLRKGSIYLIENVSLELLPYYKEEWTTKKDEIEIATVFELIRVDVIKQLYEEKLTFHVKGHGKRKKLVSITKVKDMAPQELKSLVELSGYFKFIGFFKHLSLEPLKQKEKSNITILFRP